MIYTLQNVKKKTLQGEYLDENFDITFLVLTTESREYATIYLIETEQSTKESYLIDSFVINKYDMDNEYFYFEPITKARAMCNISERAIRYSKVYPNYEANQEVLQTRGFVCHAEFVHYLLIVDHKNPLRVYHDTQFECWGFHYLLDRAIENKIFTDKLSKAKDDNLAILLNKLEYSNRVYLDSIIELLGEQQRYVSYEIE